MMNRTFVAGHVGMVRSAIVRQLLNAVRPQESIICRSRDEVDLIDQGEVHALFKAERFDEVYLAAARVDGIHANDRYPAEFIYQSLMIQANVIHAAFTVGVRKLLFLGSSCIYPRLAAQPMRENAPLSRRLEPTNDSYAIAKSSGINLCES